VGFEEANSVRVTLLDLWPLQHAAENNLAAFAFPFFLEKDGIAGVFTFVAFCWEIE